jgi:hypothetical protein
MIVAIAAAQTSVPDLWVALGVIVAVVTFYLGRRRTRLLPQRPLFAKSRGYRAYLGAIRAQPGFPYRVLSLVAFSVSLAVSKGAIYAGLVVAASLIAVATVGFVYWRRCGR